MRILALSIATALAPTPRVLAAAAAVPTGEGNGLIVERPTLVVREGVSSVASIVAHEQSCLKNYYTASKWDTKNCVMSDLFPPAVGLTTLTAPPPATVVEESEILAAVTEVQRRDDISKLASIIAHEAHEEACLSALTAGDHVPDCPTLFFPPRAIPITTTISTPPAQTSASAGEVAHAVDMISKAGPFGPLGSAIASYEHSVACSKIGSVTAWCDATTSKGRRDALPDATTTIHMTVQSTSTITSTTTKAPWEVGLPGPPGSDSPWPFGHGPSAFSAPTNIAFHIDTTSITITNPTQGVNVVETTVVEWKTIKEVTVKPTLDSTTSTTTTIPTTISTSICSNNTAIDTQSYLNISTWSMASCSTCTPRSSGSGSSPASVSSTIAGPHTHTTKLGGTKTTTHMESSAAIPGFGNPTTAVIGSSAALSGKAELSSIHVPLGMVAAMCVCFALALFL